MHIECRRYLINNEKLIDLKLMFFADLHIKEKCKYDYEEILRAACKINPDLICISGDLLCTYDAAYYGVRNIYNWLERLQKFCINLRKVCPIYYVDGNHELILKTAINCAYLDIYEKYISILRKSGVVVLNNWSIDFNSKYRLYGFVENPLCYQKWKPVQLNVSSIADKIGVPDNNKYNILLTHDPKYANIYSLWGADLILCGHVHGGLIRIKNHGLISPEYKLLPKYCYGEYRINNSSVIITSGINAGRRQFRIFEKPEVVFITTGQ